MERQRSQTIESLETSSGFVKCQNCRVAVPILRTLTKPKSNRIAVLQKQIKWIEEHYHYPHRGRGNTTGNSNNDGVIIKQLKQELTDLLGEDAKADKLTSLPLYSCGLLARNLYVYSKYYDRIYI